MASYFSAAVVLVPNLTGTWPEGGLILKDEPIGVEAIMSNFSGEMMDLSETLMTEGFNDFVFVLSFQSVVDAEANSQ
jgi:hypothetical protein